jgi:hypothetical protein
MSISEDIKRLESELELEKRQLREDTFLISEKLEETKDELSPTRLLYREALIFTAVAFIAGFSLGFFFTRPREAVDQVGKPAARALLVSAGTYVATLAGKKLAKRAIQAI